MEFGSRSDGYIRPSDRGDVKPYFASHESLAFGETAERPPELDQWKEKLDKKKKLAQQRSELTSKLKLQDKLSPPENGAESTKQPDTSIEMEKLRKQAIEAYKQLREKRRKLNGLNN